MTPRLCVLGSLNMDLVIRTPRFPQPGETLIGGAFQTFPGGKGANQAIAAARLGAAVSMIGCVGGDAYGHTLRDTLRAETVDTKRVLTRAGVSTGVALITVDPDGENTIIVAPGANATLTAEEVSQRRAAIEWADTLAMQLEIPLAAARRAAELARSTARRVVLNASPAQPLAVELLELVDVLVVNRGEAALLCRGVSDDSPPEMARFLHGAGVRQVVITLGADGAIGYDGGTLYNQPAFPIRAVDTTAAGDAFVGALTVALAGGQTLPEALAWGAAAGSLAAAKHGAMPSLPDRDRVAAMLGTNSG